MTHRSLSSRSQLAVRRHWYIGLTLLSIFLLLPLTRAQCAAQRLPQPVPLPPTIEIPSDTRYPGTIHLQIDATDVLRRTYQVHEIIPVMKSGLFTVLFPEWTPGDHAPNEPLEKLTGLIITANGTRLHWARDTVAVHAFHVDIPAGVSNLDVQYQYLGSTDATTGPVPR